VAKKLALAGRSRRQIAELTGISRATLLKHEGPARGTRVPKGKG
jgi:DNA-binding CsgD family transcriptional regulator